ncbi:MAG: S1C family serine protease, partial [Candidatus Saccharimonadales bacterium]
YAADVLAPFGLARGTGFFGVSTRVELLKLLVQAVAPSPTPTPTPTPLPAASVGNAGSQTVYPTTGTQAQTDQTEAVIAKASPAVVSIIITKQVPEYQIGYDQSGLPVYQPTNQTQTQEIGAGTGFIITPDGYILTNKHVVFDNQATYTVELASGQKQTATITYKDPNNDVAILKIPSENYPALALGDSDSLKAGQPVIAIGNALGEYSNSVSLGIVSGLHRNIQAYDSSGVAETLSDVIQTDAGINPGNSGGPLLDLNGSVVGINVAEVQGSNNISFALPINPIKTVANQILPNENVK